MLAAVLTLLLAVPAAGQQEALARGTIEGGYTGFNADISEGVSLSVDGYYVGGSGRVHDRVDIYGAWNRFSLDGNSSDLTQLGGQFRLGSARWLTRVSLRGGIVHGDGETRVTGGFAVHLGRQAGGLVSADYASVDGVLVGIVHIGGYVGFGGGN